MTGKGVGNEVDNRERERKGNTTGEGVGDEADDGDARDSRTTGFVAGYPAIGNWVPLKYILIGGEVSVG
jgi:hypothetical protein